MRTGTATAAALAFVLSAPSTRAQQPAGPFEALACAPGNADVAAVLAGGLVHVTRDGGATWTSAFIGFSGLDGEDEGEPGTADPEWLESPVEEERENHEDEPEEKVEAEWLDGPAGERTAEREPSARPLLAVADDGRWAVLRGETLAIGGAGNRREIGLPAGARGLRFDGAGDLWIAAEGRLVRVDPDGAAWEVPARANGAPIRGPGGGVLVPAMDGLLLAGGSRDDLAVMTLVRLPVAAVRALAWNPARPSAALVASRGRLVRVTLAGGVAAGAGSAFADADRLAADAGGGLLLRREDGSWYRRGRTGWRRIDAVDIDIDAAGRPWLAADRGISTPVAGRPAVTGSPPPFAAAGFLEPVDEIGPPPCEPVVAFPVPRVDLFFGIGHGSTRTATEPEDTDHLGRRARIEGGLRLTGDFGAGAGADCLPRREAWARQQDQRRRRLATLTRARALAAAELAGKPALSRAAWLRLESERLAELIRLMTGTPPESEERP